MKTATSGIVSRDDDVITTAGFRVGPSEIEDCLLKHPAVAMSAVVGIPDPVRTESIKAWIVLRPGFAASDQLAREIQDFVKVKLAAHEYPRFVQFADALPMTATGKVLRRELRALGDPDRRQRLSVCGGHRPAPCRRS